MTGPTPAFCGPLAREFDRFARQMTMTGGYHYSLFTTIRRLDAFLLEKHPTIEILSRAVVADWFSSFDHVSPRSQRRYRSSTFLLCRFLTAHQPKTAAIDDFERPPRAPPFRPYIFSTAEVALLLRTARSMPVRPTDPLRPWTMELLVSVLYAAGLRVGEAIRLDVGDYETDEQTLTIRETKFAKSRMVALSPSADALVRRYMERRRAAGLSLRPGDSLLWPLRASPDRPRPCLGAFQVALVRLLRRTGLKPASGRAGPRIHDLRHTFAVHRILQWYREDVDVQAHLPHLVTYMGHRDLASTQHYLSLIPEVLHEANRRFEHFAAPPRGPE